MDMSALAMPIAGLTFGDIHRVAKACHGNRVQTAKRLGVHLCSLRKAIDRNSLHDWFVSGTGRGVKFRPRCVSREQIIDIAKDGYSYPDTAFLLGISLQYLVNLIDLWNLKSYFAPIGKRISNGMRGYAV